MQIGFTKSSVCLFLLLPIFAFGQLRWYKGNIHAHTTESDGQLSPNQLVQAYINLGYDFIAITDHFSVVYTDRFRDLLVIQGQELTSTYHISGLDLARTVNAEGMSADQQVKAILSQNSIPILNHPTYTPPMPANWIIQSQKLYHMEIYNAMVQFGGGYDDQTLWDTVLSSGKKIYGVASDDAHYAGDIGKAWIVVQSYKLGKDEILGSFGAGQYYCSNGIELDDVDVQPGKIHIKSRNGTSVKFIGQNRTLLDSVRAPEAIYAIKGTEGYIRAVISDDAGRTAWTQPLVYYDYKQPCLILKSGDAQVQTVNRPLQQPLVVQARDLMDNPLAGVPVRFRAVAGGAHFNGESRVDISADQDGIARIQATLGTTAGDGNQVFIVSATKAYNPVQITATATSGVAAKLVLISGNNQQGKVNRTLQPLIAAVTDVFGNAISEAPISFTVFKGDGTVNGLKSVTVSADKNGMASVQCALGALTGEQIITLTSSLIPAAQAQFKLQALVGDPALLTSVSGNRQIGESMANLPAPFVVAVTDSFKNPVASHIVTFTVKEGDGLLNRNISLVVSSNAAGQASALLRLGPDAAYHLVTASSSLNNKPLQNSPVSFVASLKPIKADSLAYSSGNNQTGIIRRPLPQPLRVLVTDAQAHPVMGHRVIFKSLTPTAHFAGRDTVHSFSDENGIAQALPTLGIETGFENYVFEAQSLDPATGHWLRGAPVRFKASAQTGRPTYLVSLMHNAYSGTVHSELADSLCMRVEDEYHNPLSGHAVHFRCFSAGSWLNGRPDSVTVTTAGDGSAAVAVRLPDHSGKLILQASAGHGTVPLNTSPISCIITVQHGPLDVGISRITTGGPVTADGRSAALLQVLVTDAFGNPIPDILVQFHTSDQVANLKATQTTTDSMGLAQATVTSIRADLIQIWATLTPKQIPLKPVALRFIAGPPYSVAAMGQGQIKQRLAILPSPVGVRVLDRQGNPVPDIRVIFAVQNGGGMLLPSAGALTDSSGAALVQWQLGAEIGEQRITAQLQGLAQKYFITAEATPVPAAALISVSGDKQIGLVNSPLPGALVVAVKDSSGQPAAGHQVLFHMQGDNRISSPNPATSDATGMAAAQLQTGSNADEFTVTVRIPGLSDSLLFHFLVQAQPGVNLTDPSEIAASGRPGDQRLVSLMVRDGYQRPLPGEQIEFAVLEGGGWPDKPVIVQSDARAEAHIYWRWGPLGRQVLQARPAEKQGHILRWEAFAGNTAPRLALPNTMTCFAGDSLLFIVEANDSENDSLTIAALHLPPGAAFDAASRRFTWQTTAAQAGTYQLIWVARDCYGAADTARVEVDLLLRNQRPQILSSVPADTLLHAVHYMPMEFSLTAHDPDGDSLTYTWLVNGHEQDHATAFTIRFTTLFPRENLITALVSDGRLETSTAWRIVLAPTGVVESDESRPVVLGLGQNYPNPFNASTLITFSTPTTDHVILRIQDRQGRAITTLIDQNMPAGNHEIRWQARGIASGIYLCRLISSAGIQTRKIILVK